MDKTTALTTQMRYSNFDYQHATKTTQRRAVNLGMEEVNGNLRWLHSSGFHHPNQNAEVQQFNPTLFGAVCFYWIHPHDAKLVWKVNSKMKGKNGFRHCEGTVRTLEHVLNNIEHNLEIQYTLTVRTACVVYDSRVPNCRQVYRAHPYLQGAPWEDYAMFDLSLPDNPSFRSLVPAQIKAFLDLRDLPVAPNKTDYVPGMYAVLEPLYANPDVAEQAFGLLWQPFKKKPNDIGSLAEKKINEQIVVNLDRLRSPTVVVPDPDNHNKRAYLRMVPRSQWPFLFEHWLKADDTREFEDDQFDH